MSRYDAGFPSAPLIDRASGEATPAWRRFLEILWTRTGETSASAIGVSSGVLNAELQALLTLGRQPSVVVVPTGSPFAYVPSSSGVLIVAGGGVTAMTVRRGTGTPVAVGQFYAGHRLTSSDTLTVSYGVAPQMTWFPG